jgi:hypothetical protein
MKIITTRGDEPQVFGPFAIVIEEVTCFRCDGVVLPKDVLGECDVAEVIETEPVEVPPLTEEELLLAQAQTVAREIEARIDLEYIEPVPKAWGYRDSDRLAGYANSKVAQWKADAEAFLSWRDDVWVKGMALQNAWRPGDDMPTYEATVKELPPVPTKPVVQ